MKIKQETAYRCCGKPAIGKKIAPAPAGPVRRVRLKGLKQVARVFDRQAAGTEEVAQRHRGRVMVRSAGQRRIDTIEKPGLFIGRKP